MRTLIFSLWLVVGPPPAAATVIYLADFGDFEGRGLAPTAATGHLDSRHWVVHGFSDGDTRLGDRRTGGDAGRGRSPGGVSAGGLYAFDVAPGTRALGVQPTGTDFTPGGLGLRVASPAGDALSVDFDLWTRNDADRATRVDLDLADAAGRVLARLYTATGAQERETDPRWRPVSVSATAPLAGVPPGDDLWLWWRAADAAGRGSRDEFAIGALRVATTRRLREPAGAALLAGGLLWTWWLRRRPGTARVPAPGGWNPSPGA